MQAGGPLLSVLSSHKDGWKEIGGDPQPVVLSWSLGARRHLDTEIDLSARPSPKWRSTQLVGRHTKTPTMSEGQQRNPAQHKEWPNICRNQIFF